METPLLGKIGAEAEVTARRVGSELRRIGAAASSQSRHRQSEIATTQSGGLQLRKNGGPPSLLGQTAAACVVSQLGQVVSKGEAVWNETLQDISQAAVPQNDAMVQVITEAETRQNDARVEMLRFVTAAEMSQEDVGAEMMLQVLSGAYAASQRAQAGTLSQAAAKNIDVGVASGSPQRVETIQLGTPQGTLQGVTAVDTPQRAEVIPVATMVDTPRSKAGSERPRIKAKRQRTTASASFRSSAKPIVQLEWPCL